MTAPDMMLESLIADTGQRVAPMATERQKPSEGLTTWCLFLQTTMVLKKEWQEEESEVYVVVKWYPIRLLYG